MSLQDKLLEDTKEAMRNRDKARRSILNFLRSAIHNEEIRKQSQLKDQDVIEVISRQAIQIKESITEFTKGNRLDLVAKEQADLLILEEYLPVQMSRAEILKIAELAINNINPLTPAPKKSCHMARFLYVHFVVIFSGEIFIPIRSSAHQSILREILHRHNYA